MSWNVVVADLDAVKGDRLVDAVRTGLGPEPGVVVLTGAARHPLWRNSHAKVARDLELLVAGGGNPAAGMMVLTSLALDVVKAESLALSTPGNTRRRGAVAVEIAPNGRGESARQIVVAADLSDAEWASHEREIRQRLLAMGFSKDAPVLLAAVGGRLATLESLDSAAEVGYVDGQNPRAGVRSFSL